MEGFRMTQARMTILDVLAKERIKPPSAEDIYFLIHRINPAIGLATIYRNLDLLTRMEIIHKFDFGNGKTRYELNYEEKEKLHIIILSVLNVEK